MLQSPENRAVAGLLAAGAVLAPQIAQPNVLAHEEVVQPPHTIQQSVGETGVQGALDTDLGPGVTEQTTDGNGVATKTMTFSQTEAFAPRFEQSGPAALAPSAEQTKQFTFDVAKDMTGKGYDVTAATVEGLASDDATNQAADQTTAGLGVPDASNLRTAQVRGENAVRIDSQILNDTAGHEVPMTQEPAQEVPSNLGTKVQELAAELHTTPNKMVKDFDAGQPLPPEAQQALDSLNADRGVRVTVTGTKGLPQSEVVQPTTKEVTVEGPKTPYWLFKDGALSTQTRPSDVVASTNGPLPKEPRDQQPGLRGNVSAQPQNIPAPNQRIIQPRAYNGARYGRTDRTRHGV